MRFRIVFCAALMTLDLVGAQLASATEPPLTRPAVERSLDFLERDAVKWRKEHECSTCHHGTMTIWALTEAASRGYTVAPETLADMATWAKQRALERLDQPRDSRPGWNLVKLPAMLIASMAQANLHQKVVSRDELKLIAAHVARHQEAEGFWSVPPPKNGPPPVFESTEVYTLWAILALGSERESTEKATAWLKKSPPTNTTQAGALRLLVEIRTGSQPSIDSLLKCQNPDGGWGQVAGIPSDAYATGQTLYMLSLAGVMGDRPEVKRAVAFLVGSQKEDGSWPMTSRAQPGEKPFTNPVPITYFGSAWATLGLIRMASN